MRRNCKRYHALTADLGLEPARGGLVAVPGPEGLLRGGLLTYSWAALLGLWYFTMALMNHNAEHTHDVERRNKARDWGEAQLVSSADWGVQLPFRRAWVYLWLNYHTVHHLFPRLDFSHHPAAQAIIIEVRAC